MLNFIYGALTMWLIFGVIAICKYTFIEARPTNWADWLVVLITFPFFVIAMSMKITTESFNEIKEKIKFNWEYEWKWKIEEIKEKIKYRY